jgi:hypothetical protein
MHNVGFKADPGTCDPATDDPFKTKSRKKEGKIIFNIFSVVQNFTKKQYRTILLLILSDCVTNYLYTVQLKHLKMFDKLHKEKSFS